jgi:uncharacterized protein YbjT (DUF2867 family)
LTGKTLLIAGATGLVGRHALRLALADERVGRVVAPSRRPLPAHPKLLNPIEDFAHLPPLAPWWRVDCVVCALGTTMAKAGSQAAFEAVDYEMPLAVARLALRQGAQAFALNSALGANPESRVFYSRVKGELEQTLRDMKNPGYASLTLVRPGLIGGDRPEQRRGESLAIAATRLLSPLLPRRYRLVPAERIAHHLLEAALAATPGVKVLESEQLL